MPPKIASLRFEEVGGLTHSGTELTVGQLCCAAILIGQTDESSVPISSQLRVQKGADAGVGNHDLRKGDSLDAVHEETVIFGGCVEIQSFSRSEARGVELSGLT